MSREVVSHRPSWSPDCRKIAYERADEIYVMEADGSGQGRLCEGSSPAWSPDGERIAFVKEGALYIVYADGSDQRMLVSQSSDCSGPDWSPDGARIVFGTFPFHDGSFKNFVNIMYAVGSNLVVLCRGRQPAWSPDGGRIAFAGFRDGLYDIYIVDPEGLLMPTALTGNRDRRAEFREPDWSPDGTMIVYRRDDHFRVIDADGSSDEMLAGFPYSDMRQPAWSPDGARIAFMARGEIHVMDADGSNQVRLTDESGTDSPNTGIELVYGNGGEGSVFLERGYAEDIRNFQKALCKAATWGEIRDMAGEDRYQETVERWREGEIDRLMDEEGVEEDEVELSLHKPEDKFDADSIWGYADGDWPEFAPRMMDTWVDAGIIREYGWNIQTTISGEYPVINPDEEETVVSLLEKQGYVCTPDEDLVWDAVWGG